jgi:alkylation response protein AidB-like acyl-CoA dehydrogenase
MFLVPLDAPGITVRPLTTIAGTSEFNAVTFDAAPLPEDALLGPEAGGWPIIRSLLSRERSGYNSYRLLRPVRRGVERFVRMIGNGSAGRPEEAARLYARALASHELVVDLLVDEASPEPTPAFGSLVKLFVTEAVRKQGRAEAAAFGDRERAALDDAWVFDVLDSMHYTISAGTSEIQRNIVASRMLDLPSSR